MFRWTFDPVRQELQSPMGYRVTVKEIAVQLQDRVYCRFDLPPPWKGWRIRGGHLIAPGGKKFTPALLRRIDLDALSDAPSRLPGDA